MSFCWVDGVPGGTLPANDPAVTLGLSVFETMRTYGRVIFRLDAHLKRLSRSAEVMGLSFCEATLREELTAAIGENFYLRATLTGGGRRVVQSRPLDLSRVGRPVTLGTLRDDGVAALPGSVKHGSRAGWVLEARRQGVNEVLRTSSDGRWLETNNSNIFVVRGDEVWTPPADGEILAGVTRGALLEAAEAQNFPIKVAPVFARDGLDAMFVSSTLKTLAPVRMLDGVWIASDEGILARLGQALRRLIDGAQK